MGRQWLLLSAVLVDVCRAAIFEPLPRIDVFNPTQPFDVTDIAAESTTTFFGSDVVTTTSSPPFAPPHRIVGSAPGFRPPADFFNKFHDRELEDKGDNPEKDTEAVTDGPVPPPSDVATFVGPFPIEPFQNLGEGPISSVSTQEEMTSAFTSTEAPASSFSTFAPTSESMEFTTPSTTTKRELVLVTEEPLVTIAVPSEFMDDPATPPPTTMAFPVFAVRRRLRNRKKLILRRPVSVNEHGFQLELMKEHRNGRLKAISKVGVAGEVHNQQQETITTTSTAEITASPEFLTFSRDSLLPAFGNSSENDVTTTTATSTRLGVHRGESTWRRRSLRRRLRPSTSSTTHPTTLSSSTSPSPPPSLAAVTRIPPTAPPKAARMRTRVRTLLRARANRARALAPRRSVPIRPTPRFVVNRRFP